MMHLSIPMKDTHQPVAAILCTGGPDVIQKEAWSFYRTIPGVRLCWELVKDLKDRSSTRVGLRVGTTASFIQSVSNTAGLIDLISGSFTTKISLTRTAISGGGKIFGGVGCARVNSPRVTVVCRVTRARATTTGVPRQ